MGTARLIAALLVCAGCAHAGDEQWVELFNGEDLDDWIVKVRGYPAGENFADTFRVEDGLLTVSYDGYDKFDSRYGHIFYKTTFSHYRLLIEYRFVGNQAPGGQGWAWRNSGIMVHPQDPATMPPEQDFPISVEVQFLGGKGDGKSRPTANMCSPGTHIVYEGKFTRKHCITRAATSSSLSRLASKLEIVQLTAATTSPPTP